MHLVIDVLAAIILLFFFLTGWHKGFLLSALSVVRVVISYGGAYFAGRYLGSWLGVALHRPRIVMVPVCAFMAFALITFIFHVIMTELRTRHELKAEKENFKLPVLSRLSGSAINLSTGVFSLVVIFWLADLFLVGIAGMPIPGAGKAYFSRFARKSIYEAACFAIPKKYHQQRVAALARMISNPSNCLDNIETVLAAPSIQHLFADPCVAEDILSGDPARIGQNAAIQQLFNDRATLEELKAIGVFSGYETREDICDRLATIGKNQKIRSSLEDLKERELLSTDKIPKLIRDPEFDVIIGELLK